MMTLPESSRKGHSGNQTVCAEQPAPQCAWPFRVCATPYRSTSRLRGRWHMVTILLKCGAAVYAPRGRGTPLQLSAYVDSVKCAEALATRANLNARCERAPQS